MPTTALMGIEWETLSDALTQTFERKGQEVVDLNVGAARAAFERVVLAEEVSP